MINVDAGLEVRLNLRRNRFYYLSFLLCVILGLVIGIIIVSSNDSYINIISQNERVLYYYINGTAEIGQLFWLQLIKFLLPAILLFLLGLYYFTSLISFIFITYQISVLVLSCSALISIYGISGVINTVLLILPINLIFILSLIFLSVTLIERGKRAWAFKDFKLGFDRVFFAKCGGVFLFLFLLTIVSSLLIPLFIKSAFFVIF